MTATLLPRENAQFILGPTPVLLIGEAPIHGELPALHVPDGNVPVAAGWQLMARLTVCVVDGPGDSGCLIPTVGGSDDVEGVAAWCAAVEQAGGAIVVSVPVIPGRVDWNLVFTGGAARGGFVRNAEVG